MPSFRSCVAADADAADLLALLCLAAVASTVVAAVVVSFVAATVAVFFKRKSKQHRIDAF